MLYKKDIKIILDIIEQQKNKKLTVEQLSAAVYMSSSHLQLLFKQLTGQTLMDYARGRKLVHSLIQLFDTDMRVIDIAQEYGFEHEQSYTRAFRTEFGCTPGQARRNRYELNIRERITLDSLIEVGGGLMSGPEHIIVPKFHIIGVPTFFRDFDSERDGLLPNAVGNTVYFNVLKDLPVGNPDIYYGLSRFLNEKDLEYMPSVQVPNLAYIPEGLKGWTFPTHECVRFRYFGKHPPDEISMAVAKETYTAITCYFMSQSRYVFSEGYHIERIDINNYDGIYCQMELIYPVTDHQV